MTLNELIPEPIAGMSARGRGLTETTTTDPDFLGFCWWYWIPRFSAYKAEFKAGNTYEVSVMWLCFYFGALWLFNGKDE